MSHDKLNQEARSFVDQALAVEPALDRGAHDRLRSKVLRSAAGLVAAGGVAATHSSLAAGAAAVSGTAGQVTVASGTSYVLATKIAASVLAIGLAGGGAVAWRAQHRVSIQTISVAQGPASSPRATSIEPSGANEPAATPTAPPAAIRTASPAAQPSRPRADSSPFVPSAVSSRSSLGPVTDSFSEELAALERARKALTDGDPSSALREIAESERLASARTFAEERDALRVVALCSAGRQADGRKLASAFRSRFPRSLHIERIERACAKVVTDSASGGHSSP